MNLNGKTWRPTANKKRQEKKRKSRVWPILEICSLESSPRCPVLATNNELSSEIAELKNAFEAQKRKLNDTKELLEKTMNLNLQLKEELGQARDKIKEQAEEIAELYDFQDELEQYTRENSVEICGIPESAYEST